MTGTWRASRLVVALAFVLAAHASRGDAVSELAAFSAFPKADLAQLSKTPAKPVRGEPGANPRHLNVQTVYVVPGAPADVAARMRSWNPAQHPELKVYLYSNGTDFSRLAGAPDNAAVRYLADASAQHSSSLQLSGAELAQLPQSASAGTMTPAIAAAWGKILAGRAQAFASGGSAAQPPYQNTTPPVRPNDELSALLRGQDKIRRQFAGLLEATGVGRGGGSMKPDLYWELESAEEKGVLTLGAHYSKPGPNGTIQTVSARYYASEGYYVGVTLHQLWPVEVEGRASTLVWRGDLISSQGVGDLRGIERMGAESTMIKNVGRSVAAFRATAGR